MKLDGTYLKKLREERGMERIDLSDFLSHRTNEDVRLIEEGLFKGGINMQDIREISIGLQLSVLERMKLQIAFRIMPEEIVDLMPDDLLIKIFSEIVEAPIPKKEKELMGKNLNASLKFTDAFIRQMIKKSIRGEIPPVK